MEMSYETITMLAYGIILTDDEARKISDRDGDIDDEIGATGCNFDMWGNQVSGDTGYVLIVKDSQQYGGDGWVGGVSVDIGEDWDRALALACETVSIEYREPSWLLVSEYG
jgi:hypothetical protein